MSNTIKRIYITTEANYDDGGDIIPSLYFDAVTQIAPTYTQNSSDYKLSDGSNLNFHIIKDPVTLTMEAWISSTPIYEPSNNMIGYSSLSNRPKAATDLLLAWYTNNTLLYIEAELESYTNMILVNIQPELTGFDSVRFKLTFKKQIYASYQKTTLINNVSTAISKDGGTATTSSQKAAKTDAITWHLSEEYDALTTYADVKDAAKTATTGE